jgi:ABC-type sugar transport system substrate-binding protein
MMRARKRRNWERRWSAGAIPSNEGEGGAKGKIGLTKVCERRTTKRVVLGQQWQIMEEGMTKKRVIMFVAILIGCLFITSQVSGQAKKLQFGLMLRSIDIEFFQRIDTGVKEACEIRGIGITSQYYGNDASRAVQIAESFITQKKDGVVFSPLEATSATVIIKKFAAAGIPVVLVDNVPRAGMFGPQLSSIISEGYRGGYAAGQAMIKLLRGNGKIARQDFTFRVDVIDQRNEGFVDAIALSNIKEVQVTATDGTRSDTTSKVPGVLSRNPDLDGFFCCQGDAATAVFAAAKTMGREKRLKIVAYDVTEDIKDIIRQGVAVGVDQFPDEMGRRAVAYLAANKEGRRVPYLTFTPVIEVNKENVDLHKNYKEFLHSYGGGFQVTDYGDEVTKY